jgi:deoxyribodipyrimidine photolyase-related protein
LKTALKKLKISILHIAELDDVYLEKNLNSLAKLLKFRLEIKPSPGFLTDLGDFKSLFKGKKNLRFETFYIHQRRKLALLLNEEGKPLGGKWSLDQENRKKLPRSIHIPKPFKARQGKEVKEAIAYVKQKYAKNPGSAELFNYPTTHSEAKKALQYFLKNRFALFGDYEDAIAQKEPILFHSCLSPLLNVGLLTPDLVIKEAIKYFENHKIPLNSAEGFIRQIIGWREFIRGAYSFIGEKERAANFFKHQRKIPQSFYEATTGILPVDETIKKLQNHAYVHHIERLMILGNFFLLCEIDPNEVYRWFMEFFIDSYDWVMVPNVYGMSQYADGGLMTTKPYFSSSNYLLKMSDYKKGEWCEIWDALFWRFMIKNRSFFAKQPRLSMLCQIAEKKKKDKNMLNRANGFLRNL